MMRADHSRPDVEPGVWVRVWLVLILAGCLVTLAAAPLPHIDGDGPLYGKIAKNVLASGEWLTLHFRPGAVVDKPPLTIWLMAISLRVAGDTDAALRFWQLLMNLALVFVTFRIARLGAGREESLLAALMLVTTLQVFYQALTPQQDVPLALFLALAFYAYLRYRQHGRTREAVLAGLWVAFAVLTKGIVGLAVFGLIVGADLLVARRRSDASGRWRWTQVAVGAAAFLIIAAPWFVIGTIRQGTPFVDTFFLRGSLGVGRFFSQRIPGIPLWQATLAYVPGLVIGMLPWTGLLPAAVRAGWRSLRAGPPSLRLCGLWAILYFLLLSLSTTDRVIRYLLPIYPPLAVLGAHVLAHSIDEPRRLRAAAVFALMIGIPVMFAGGWWMAIRFPQEFRLYLPIALPFALGFALAVVAFAAGTLWGRGRLAVAMLAGGVILSYGLVEWALLQHWERIWPWRALGATVNRLYRPGDHVLVFRDPFGFPEYFIDAPVTVANDEAAIAQAWRTARVFGILPLGAFNSLPGQPRPIILMQMPTGWVLVTNR